MTPLHFRKQKQYNPYFTLPVTTEITVFSPYMYKTSNHNTLLIGTLGVMAFREFQRSVEIMNQGAFVEQYSINCTGFLKLIDLRVTKVNSTATWDLIGPAN